jgi:hypothetical protein
MDVFSSFPKYFADGFGGRGNEVWNTVFRG